MIVDIGSPREIRWRMIGTLQVLTTQESAESGHHRGRVVRIRCRSTQHVPTGRMMVHTNGADWIVSANKVRMCIPG